MTAESSRKISWFLGWRADIVFLANGETDKRGGQ